jgi:hypothetical protein
MSNNIQIIIFYSLHFMRNVGLEKPSNSHSIERMAQGYKDRHCVPNLGVAMSRTAPGPTQPPIPTRFRTMVTPCPALHRDPLGLLVGMLLPYSVEACNTAHIPSSLHEFTINLRGKLYNVRSCVILGFVCFR